MNESPYRGLDKDLVILDLKKQVEELKEQIQNSKPGGEMFLKIRSVSMSGIKDLPYAFQLELSDYTWFTLNVSEFGFQQLDKPNVGDKIKVSFSR